MLLSVGIHASNLEAMAYTDCYAEAAAFEEWTGGGYEAFSIALDICWDMLLEEEM